MKKKSPNADLESKRPYFFKIGLIIACSLVWYAFEWETAYASSPIERPDTEVIDDPYEDEVLRAVQFKKEKPKPPAPVKKSKEKIITKTITEFINIVETEIDDNINTEEDDIIEIDEVEEEGEALVMMGLVEFKPRFPGCEDAGSEDDRFTCFQQSIMNHIQSNFKYPEVAKGLGIEGKVYVRFVIDKKGEINDISIGRSADKYLDAEAKRLISMLPQMIPARQFNKAVAVEYVVPINFKLN